MADKLQFEGLKSAADLCKQVITLATGVITLTVTFIDKFGTPAAQGAAKPVSSLLYGSWGAFAVSILFAMITLGAITGTLNAIDKKANGTTLSDNERAAVDKLAYANGVFYPSQIMAFTFVLGLALAVLAAIAR